MRNFVFEKIPKVYFGEGSLKQALSIELSKVGKNVMITYLVKRNIQLILEKWTDSIK